MHRTILALSGLTVCLLSVSLGRALEEFTGEPEVTLPASGLPSTGPMTSAPLAPHTAPAAPKVTTPDTATPSGRYALELKDGTRLIGIPLNQDALPIAANFGRTSVPMSLIAAATFDAGKKQVRITFRNGDTLTGSPRIDRLKLKTEYGEVTAPIESIARMASGDKFVAAVSTAAAQPVKSETPPVPRPGVTVWGSDVGFDSFILPAAGQAPVERFISPAVFEKW